MLLIMLILIMLTLMNHWTTEPWGLGTLLHIKREFGTTRSDIGTSLDNCVMRHLFSEHSRPSVMFPSKQFETHKKTNCTNSWWHVKDKYNKALSDLTISMKSWSCSPSCFGKNRESGYFKPRNVVSWQFGPKQA